MHISLGSFLFIICVLEPHVINTDNIDEFEAIQSQIIQLNSTPRFSKCCPFDAYFDGHECEKRSNLTFRLRVFSPRQEFYESRQSEFVIGLPECYTYPYKPDLFQVQENGTLFMTFNRLVRNDEYCVELSEADVLTAFVCQSYTEYLFDDITGIGLMISLPFLIATSLAYICLPERTLHIKAHVCYIITLSVATAILIYFQFETDNRIGCIIFGYLEYYFSIASFYWLNVICINMWRTFSGKFSDSRFQNGQFKLFLIYNLYGWGMPILQTAIVIIIDKFTDTDSFFHPGLINGFCYFTSYYGMILYNQIPIGILLLVNIILFVRTSRRIKKIDDELFKRNGSRRHQIVRQQKTVNIYIKVVLTMGVNWLLDFILWMAYLIWNSPAHYQEYIWHFIKLHNAIYGISLFFIFICKKRTWNLLKKRFFDRETSSRRFFYST